MYAAPEIYIVRNSVYSRALRVLLKRTKNHCALGWGESIQFPSTLCDERRFRFSVPGSHNSLFTPQSWGPSCEKTSAERTCVSLSAPPLPLHRRYPHSVIHKQYETFPELLTDPRVWQGRDVTMHGLSGDPG
jgi:hypothetical protein